jgi:hypothetical protein
MAEETVNKVNNCFYPSCDSVAIGFCRHCGQEFCEQHRSRYDTRFCSDCITEDAMRLEESPLVDDEGVTHEGRRIRLIGEGWPASMEMIRTLTDDQLEFKIGEWKRLLAEAVKTQEYFRITVCAAEFEKEDRYKSKVRKLQRRREELQQGAVRLNSKKTRVKPPKDPAEALAIQLGITVEQARAVMKITAGARV